MTINNVRYLHFMAGVLVSQQADPLCSRCKAFANTLVRVREALGTRQPDVSGDATHDDAALLEEARRRLGPLVVQEDAVGQKKAGNCLLPEGVCFVKIPKKIGEAF